MPERVLAAEGAIKAAGLSVADFCRSVKVHRATWQRWKSGKSAPNVRDWERVIAKLREMPPLGEAAADSGKIAA